MIISLSTLHILCKPSIVYTSSDTIAGFSLAGLSFTKFLKSWRQFPTQLSPHCWVLRWVTQPLGFPQVCCNKNKSIKLFRADKPWAVEPRYILCTTSLAISYVSHLFVLIIVQYRTISIAMKKVNKQCLLDTHHTVRVSKNTSFWQVIVQTSRP